MGSWQNGSVSVEGDGTLPDGTFAVFNPLLELCIAEGAGSAVYRWWFNAVRTQVATEVINLDLVLQEEQYNYSPATDFCYAQIGLVAVLTSRMWAHFLWRHGYPADQLVEQPCFIPG